jgi:hypothetical protein
MAITETLINNDLDMLADIISGFNGITIGKEVESGLTVLIRLVDSDENTIAQVQYANPSSPSTSNITFTAILSAGVYEQITMTSGIGSAWKCANGIMVTGKGSNYKAFTIVKTNQGKTAFVIQTDNTYPHYRNLACVAYGDIGTQSDVSMREFTFTPTIRNTTVVTPVPTAGAYGQPSYTYKSGIIPFNKNYESGKYGEIILDGRHFLTNTYFAIEDESDS